MSRYLTRNRPEIVASGRPIAFIAPIWCTSSSSVPRITNRRLSRAIAISRRLASTSTTATIPSLMALIIWIITKVTAGPFFGRPGSAA